MLVSVAEVFENPKLFITDGKLHFMVAVKVMIAHTQPIGPKHNDLEDSAPAAKKKKSCFDALFSAMCSRQDMVTLKLDDGSELGVFAENLRKFSGFAIILTPELLAKSGNVVVVPNITKDVMVQVVRFVCSGELESESVLEKYAIPLIKAAHRFKIADLFGLCAEFIVNAGLNEVNLIEMIMLAHASDHHELFSACCDKIKM